MDSDLPRYTRGSTSRSGDIRRSRDDRPPTEHLYHLSTSKGQPWLTLKVNSKAPASHYLPSFYQGEAITGSVRLSLDKGEPIKSVTVQIFGQMTSSVTDVLTFLRLSEVVWSRPLPSDAPSPLRPGKLVGEYDWPFSMLLPDKCHLQAPSPDGGSARSYPLPASFSERMARIHIQYQIVVTVHRSRFRVDSTIGTVIGYCPVIRPTPPSVLRQIAYLENSPLIGPAGDPDGWECLEPLHIHGSVFSTRTIEATCTLALAKPLCYTRGSAIPCLMTFETADPQALDLLSAPRSPVVRLLRQISTHDATVGSTPAAKALPTLDFGSSVQDVATAVWWSEPARDPTATGVDPRKRTLHGEIHLSSALKPSCRLGKFELSYSVAVYPPRAVAFVPRGGAEAVLQREPVVIGTVYAAGPRPRIYSPPGYDDASSAGRTSEFCLFR